MKLTACVLATILVGAVDALFDCRRNKLGSCLNGATCDTDNGDCTSCPGMYEGYDCSVPIADKNDAACTGPSNPCENGGTCHKAAAAATFTCLCTEDYSGSTCTEKRYAVDCTGGEMAMSIIPHIDSFSGTIFIEGKHGVSDCQFTVNNGKYELTLTDTHTDCGDAEADPSGHKSRNAIVKFDQGITMAQDERVFFMCQATGTIDATVPIVTVTNVLTNINEEVGNNAPEDRDITFTLKQSDGSQISGDQDLGVKLTAEVNLTTEGSKKFEAVRFELCTAGSHAADSVPDYQSRKMIESFCISPELVNSIDGDIVLTSTVAVAFTFKAFKFDASNEIHIKCTVEACLTIFDCTPATCTAPLIGSGLGRKKREAGYSVHRNLTQRITIRDPFAGNAVAAAKEEAKACYQTWQMTATVVALAVALLLVLLLCLILITKAILNRRSTKTYREDVSVTTSSDHLPHLPTIITNKA